MTRRPKRKDDSGPELIPPAKAASEAVERIVPRKRILVERGDAVILRERVPSLNAKALAAPPWRFRLYLAEITDSQVFNSFQHAASAGEQLASQRDARLLYIEDDVVSVLADYRN